MNRELFYPSLCARKIGATLVAAIAVALGMMPVLLGEEPDATPVPQRETIEFEGIRIGFPKGEADVAAALKPALLEYRRERKRLAAEEAEAFAAALANVDARKMFGRQIATVMGREAPSDGLEARFGSRTAIFRKFAEAWRKWSGDISEIQLWAPGELKPFRIRTDGGEDEDGKAFRFPQISFGKDGSKYAIHLPFGTGLPGLDALLNLEKENAPLRLDFPLFYKPGESPEKIAEFIRGFVGQLPKALGKQMAREFGGVMPYWVFEYLLLGEVETLWVDARTARDTALAEALARNLFFVYILNREGEEKALAQVPLLFPFTTMGADLPDNDAIIATVEKMDPLAAVDPAKVTERIIARNLIALTFMKIAQTKGAKVPIFHKFKEAGIAIPKARFSVETFTAAVDEAYGEKGFFRRMLAAQQKETAGQLRESLTKKKENAKPAPPPAPPTIAPALPNRESAKYDGLTLTFPPELKGAMAILGPQCAKALANARALAEKLKPKSEKPAALEVTDEDLAAYARYGLEASAETIRNFAALVPQIPDAKAFLVRFFSSDRAAVWFNEELIALLKAGTEVPGFSLNPDGKSVGWDFKWGANLTSEEFRRLSREGKDIAAELQKRADAQPPVVLPMVAKRADLAGKLDNPEATAAAIREGDRGIFGMLLSTEKEPLKESDLAGLSRPLMSLEQVWFMVAHEAAEDAIVSSTIKSADRRWFCDGLANWIAIRDVDRRFGKGKGAEAFAKNYNAQEIKKQAGEVKLSAWPAQEDIDNGSRPQVAQVEAHYYFATLAIEKACEGHGGDFVKRWLEEIRRTPLNRTNSGTIIAAYRKLTGKDVAAIIAEVVK